MFTPERLVRAKRCAVGALGKLTNGLLQSGFHGIAFLSNSGEVLATQEQKDAFKEWLSSGGALVGFHGATDCLYDDNFYGVAIGAYFDYHPELQSAVRRASHLIRVAPLTSHRLRRHSSKLVATTPRRKCCQSDTRSRKKRCTTFAATRETSMRL